MRHFPLRELGYAFGFIFVSAAIYVGAYVALVEPRRAAWSFGVRSKYRIAHDTVAPVFGPIHALDRKVRKEYWDYENVKKYDCEP